LGSGEASNCISGKIRLGDETLATVSGHWDQEVFIKDKRSEVSLVLWYYFMVICQSDSLGFCQVHCNWLLYCMARCIQARIMLS